MEFIEFTTKVSKIPKFLSNREHSPNFDIFRKLTFFRNTIGSGFEIPVVFRKRYQTSVFVQLSKMFPEDVNFDPISTNL